MILVSLNELGCVPSFFTRRVCEKLVLMLFFFLNVWCNFVVKPSGPLLFFVGSFLIPSSVFSVIGLFTLSLYSCVSFSSLCVFRNDLVVAGKRGDKFEIKGRRFE